MTKIVTERVAGNGYRGPLVARDGDMLTFTCEEIFAGPTQGWVKGTGNVLRTSLTPMYGCSVTVTES